MDVRFITEHLGWFGAGFIFVIMSLIQIAPIKVNPWSAIGRWIGRAINGEIINKVDYLNDQMAATKEENMEQWASCRRNNILRFGDDLRHGRKFSKEHFDQILTEITKYETYCAEHPNYMNNIANATIHYIEAEYETNLENDSFL